MLTSVQACLGKITRIKVNLQRKSTNEFSGSPHNARKQKTNVSRKNKLYIDNIKQVTYHPFTSKMILSVLTFILISLKFIFLLKV